MTRVRVGTSARSAAATANSTNADKTPSRTRRTPGPIRPPSGMHQCAGGLEVLLSDRLRRPVGQRADNPRGVVPIVLWERVGARGEDIRHVPRLQVAVERGRPWVVAHDRASTGMGALIDRDVIVRTGLPALARHRLRLQRLAHIERLAREKLRCLDLILVPVEGHTQQRPTEGILVGGIQVKIMAAVRHACSLHLVIERVPERLLDSPLPRTPPTGRARRHGDSAHRSRARLSCPDDAAANEARLAVVELLAVEIVHGRAAAADANEAIGLHIFTEEHLDRALALVRVVAPHRAGVRHRVVGLADARQQHQVYVVKGERTQQHQIGGLLHFAPLSIQISHTGGARARTVEIDAHHLRISAQHEVLAQPQYRQNAHVGTGFGIIEATVVAAEATEVARPHLATVGIHVGPRGVGSWNRISVITRLARSFVEQLGPKIVAIRRQGIVALARTLERIAALLPHAVEHTRLAGGAAHVFEMIEVWLQVLVRDRKVLDGHLRWNEAAPITLLNVRAQLQVLRQSAEMAARPVAAGPADAGAGLERTDLPIRHGGIAYFVANGQGFLGQALQKLAVHGALQLVDYLRVGKVRLGVSIRSAL